MEHSPRPLTRPRLERLVRGLQSRFSSSAEALAAEVAQLTQQLEQIERRQSEELSELEQVRRNQREATTQEWDELLLARWDDAEMRSFKAVYDTATRQGNLRRDVRKRGEELTASLKQRAAELERAFLRAKDAPIARLNNFRAQNQLLGEQLTSLEQTTETMLLQRNLSPPTGAAAEPAYAPPDSSDAAFNAFQQTVEQARTVSRRLENHPAAQFFESPAWWAVCGLLFILITLGLAVSAALSWLAATLVGAVVTVAVLITALVGTRPWLKQVVAVEYPKLQRLLHSGRRLQEDGLRLAVAENDRELKRLAALRDQQFEQAKQTRTQELAQLIEKLDRDVALLSAQAVTEKKLAAQQLTQAITDCDNSFSQRLSSEWQLFTSRRAELEISGQQQRQELTARIDQLQRGGLLRQQAAMRKAKRLVDRSQRWADAHFPAWEQLQAAAPQWPPVPRRPLLPLGELRLTNLVPTASRPEMDSFQLRAPLFFSPLDDAYLTITIDPSQPLAGGLVRNLVMRALTTLPAGRTQVCVIDPPGLGRDFGWLMHLGDYDPQWVWHRVWTQPTHIARQLADLALAAEDFIQQSLRNQYRDIVAYNEEAGAMAEPYRLMIWSSFPSGLDEQSAKHLRSLLDSGARCGIIPILIIDPSLSWPDLELRDLLGRRGMHLRYEAGSRGLHSLAAPLQEFALEVEPPADEQQSRQIIQAVGERGLRASRVEVPLEQIVPAPDARWQGDSSQSLEIPIGQSGVGRVHSLKLGVGTAQHVIIAGKTGSGKSSLLHAIITSAALKYSPERLRLVLLDFKKGVEFQVYSEAALPHADIIGIESHREFGLSALEYVDACMQRRGEAFRQAAVQDLASWNLRYPQQPLPRILFVIDEFQELFVEDDKLSSQASLLLDRIVRQGRSFGVHALLSSQTLSGAYSLPRTTLGQMAVRIALQCDPSDAQIIFADDNPAAARLKFPGQAVYNDAGGRVEGNQPMQIGWLAKPQQIQWLQELPRGYRNQDSTTNRLGRCVVYDGNHAAHWRSANADLAISQAQAEINPAAMWCIAGESVAISPAVVFPMTYQAGRNVLLVGGDDQATAVVLSTIAASICTAVLHPASIDSGQPPTKQALASTDDNRHAPQIFVVQGAKPTDAWALKLPQLWRGLPCEMHQADSRTADDALRRVYNLLRTRIDQLGNEADRQSSQLTPPPVLLCLLQLGRLRSLRRDDDFGMGSFGEEELKPDKLLEEILRDGPSHGIFTLVWTENYSTLQRWLSRAALRELEIRLLMRMSGNDSTNLIDSIAASRLGEHVMLLYDEATGQEQKFRPFATESIEEIVHWGNQ